MIGKCQELRVTSILRTSLILSIPNLKFSILGKEFWEISTIEWRFARKQRFRISYVSRFWVADIHKSYCITLIARPTSGQSFVNETRIWCIDSQIQAHFFTCSIACHAWRSDISLAVSLNSLGPTGPTGRRSFRSLLAYCPCRMIWTQCCATFQFLIFHLIYPPLRISKLECAI